MENNKKSNISKIIHQFQKGRYSKEIEEKVQRWLIDEENAEEKEKASLEYWNTLELSRDNTASEALERVNTKTRNAKKKLRILSLNYLGRIAAVIVPLIIISGIYFYNHYTTTEDMYVSAMYGETKHIILPDSSEVWINSGSNISYPASFNNERHIKLEGEAYFSVKKNKVNPFIVKANKLSVKVLGTEFNVKAYPEDEKITTTLSSGKVEILPDKSKAYILKPNQQLTYSPETKEITIQKVTSSDISGWTKGQLLFINVSFTDILKTLERRFNTSFLIKETTPLTEENYTIKFLKNENVEQILTILQDVTGNFSYQKKGNIIEIIPTHK